MIFTMDNVVIPLCIIFLITCIHSSYGNLFSMLSHDQQYIMDVGSRLTMRCEFYQDHFNIFNNPVQWKKTQYGEETDINILGNVKDPFVSTGRFQVSYEPSEPRHYMGLTITNMSHVDNGNYTCDVSGPGPQLLGIVRYTIHVRAPVEELDLHQSNTPSTTDTSDVMTFVENRPTPLLCMSRGGSPPPEMKILLGRTDYTDKYFRFDSLPSKTGVFGFRYIRITSMLVTDHFKVVSNDDGKMLNCIAQVSGLAQVVKSIQISVHHAPRVQCQPAAEYIHDRNIHLTCDVTARPPVTSWFWMLDNNGTTVSEGEVANGYWPIVTKNGDGLRLELYLREVIESSFRTYMLHVANDVDNRAQGVTLERRYRDAISKPMSPGSQPPYCKHESGHGTRLQKSLRSAAETPSWNNVILITCLYLACLHR